MCVGVAQAEPDLTLDAFRDAARRGDRPISLDIFVVDDRGISVAA